MWEALKISILLTGSELVEGRLQDSNSLFVARYMDERGLKLHNILICDDDSEQIKNNLSYLSIESDIIIISGGLGPTTGDKSREAIASFLNKKLVLDLPSLQRIQDFFKSRNRPYTSNNDKQALIPEGAEVIQNDFGTATCFAARYNKAHSKFALLCALPGVPGEFERLFESKVIPAIAAHFDLADLSQARLPNVHLGIFGVSEASISDAIKQANLDPSVVVSYRATFPEVRVLLKATDNSVSDRILETNSHSAIKHIGQDYVFSCKGQTLLQVTHELLLSSDKKLALAESCSAGMLSSLIACNAGCSEYFLGSVVSYDNSVKESQLGVSPDLIEKFGAVSPEVALEMARNCQQRFNSDITISITGIAGPDGGSDNKPVGTVYLGFISACKQEVFKIFYPGSRDRIREYVCYLALDQIRRSLNGAEKGIQAIPAIELISRHGD